MQHQNQPLTQPRIQRPAGAKITVYPPAIEEHVEIQVHKDQP